MTVREAVASVLGKDGFVTEEAAQLDSKRQTG